MDIRLPPTLPGPHRAFLQRALPHLSADPRIAGVAAAGSCAEGTMDAFSDLDLVLACERAAHASLLAGLPALAASLGTLVAAFTGEHVGEPRLLVCLYEDGLHVDLKAVALDDLDDRVDDPVVLWERDGTTSRALARRRGAYPAPDPAWIEDRFWVWVHYGTLKIGRGEYLEAADFLAFLRGTVLGPLGLALDGARPVGVRHVERLAPTLARRLAATVVPPERAALIGALRECVALYRSQRAQAGTAPIRDDAERVAMRCLDALDVSADGRDAAPAADPPG